MPRRPRQIPSYRLHKPTKQAVVRLDGHDVYLGKYDTPESHEAYRRRVAEWLVSDQLANRKQGDQPKADPSINQLILAFWQHAESHYRKADGTAGGELDNFRHALRPLRRLYGQTPAATFGPLALRAIQNELTLDMFEVCRLDLV